MSNSLPLGRFSIVTLAASPSDTILEVQSSPKDFKAVNFKSSNGYNS
jgi:hypothetical protein